jgi:hypothetical protein
MHAPNKYTITNLFGFVIPKHCEEEDGMNYRRIDAVLLKKVQKCIFNLAFSKQHRFLPILWNS